jgi:hypothetical protein
MKERTEYFRPANTPLSKREKEGNESLKKREIGIPRRIRIELTALALDDSLTQLVCMSRDGVSEEEFRMHLQSCNDAMNKACYYLKKLEAVTL